MCAYHILGTRVREVKEWISPPDFMYEYETTRRNRLQGTGQWLIENDEYCAWKSAAVSQSDTEGVQSGLRLPFSDRILKLQGEQITIHS